MRVKAFSALASVLEFFLSIALIFALRIKCSCLCISLIMGVDVSPFLNLSKSERNAAVASYSPGSVILFSLPKPPIHDSVALVI